MSQPEPARAVVPPPPPRANRRGFAGAAVASVPAPEPVVSEERIQISDKPAAPPVPDNLSKPNSGLQDLNFKVDPGFHRAFKAVANERGMAMKELLESAFRAWVEAYGDEHIKAIVARHADT